MGEEMMISDDELRRIESHWALSSLDVSERNRALEVCQARLFKKALGQQFDLKFEEKSTDDDILRRTAIAYEIIAIEGLDTLVHATTTDTELRNQCIAGSWRAFELIRVMPIPENVEERIFHILHFFAIAYCGDRGADLKRWCNENPLLLEVPSVANVTWEKRILYRIFDCWIRLFRKNGWDDLDRIREIIAGLRQDQKQYELQSLDSGSEYKDKVNAFRLISLYHWVKGTELIAQYILQGEPAGITTQLDKHFEMGIKTAGAINDAQLEVLLRWLHASSLQMIRGSIWWVVSKVNSRVSDFVKEITKNSGLFELLPPQNSALKEQGLLDISNTAIVIEMPTSGGKTLLAQFKILQALNQFDADNGWIAYVTPTRALTSQITRRLRRDFEPINIKVQQLTSAVEIDSFENSLLEKKGSEKEFDILVTTPEKLQLVIRNKKVPRPLALVVMDEAHNLEDETRGLRMELLLATIKYESPKSNFLLLMPFVEKTESIAHWLAGDISNGRTISIGTTPWKPNERIFGVFWSEKDSSIRGGWRIKYETITTTPHSMHLSGVHNIGSVKPLNVPKSKLNLSLETAAVSKIMSRNGTSIAVSTKIDSVWSMARAICSSFEEYSPIPEEIKLVQNFLKTEISYDFELINMLSYGVGVHHAGLSDETRALIEWLAEEGHLRVLCTTTTIAQGLNFPVSSVFLSSRFVPQDHRSKEIPIRDFLNLAGRAGRINHDSVGVIGLASGTDKEKVIRYISSVTGEIVSRLVNLIDELDDLGKLHELDRVIHGPQWEDFRCYIAHLINEKKNIDSALADTEQILRNTFGYQTLRSSDSGKEKAGILLEATKNYARELANHPGYAELADMTGFSPEGVRTALKELNQLEHQLTPDDWTPEKMFGDNSGISEMFGIMLRIPQLADSLEKIGGEGIQNEIIGEITKAWVNGAGIQEIAVSYFNVDNDKTKSITDACKAIYRSLVNSGTWGFSALSKLSGIEFESLSDSEIRSINTIPAMIYHGVKTEEAVLMRMNNVPRCMAENIGHDFIRITGKQGKDIGLEFVRDFLRDLKNEDWERSLPSHSFMNGSDSKKIWGILSGETR